MKSAATAPMGASGNEEPQAWILAGERSSLLTHIAATVIASLCVRMKS
jgi:hypothetical protein